MYILAYVFEIKSTRFYEFANTFVNVADERILD